MTIRRFPQIVGIVNVTPDSFSDGGSYFEPQKAVKYAEQLIADGADIIDIGGESTRPGAQPVPIEEEIRRVIPVIAELRRRFPTIPISIDTTKGPVARAALDTGATMINDVSAGRFDDAVIALAAERRVPIVLMHMQGKPSTMQLNPTYTNVINEVYEFLRRRIEIARQCGVENIIADVGIGFGKTLEHNLMLLRNLDQFAKLGVPLYLGISRKRFLGLLTGIDDPKERDIPTAIMHALLIDAPIDYIRVHNVKHLRQLRTLWQALYITEAHPTTLS